jgi:hypothetical protein
MSSYKKFINSISKNKFLAQIDSFSTDINLSIKGKNTFKTLFSGIIQLLIFIALVTITYLITCP